MHALNRQYTISARGQSAGFSLMELMIVVVIIGILGAIAVNSYRASVIKSRRSAAAACLQEGAQTMERYYTVRMSYLGGTMGACSTDVTRFYTFSSGTPTATAFTLTATPNALQQDAACGTLSINQVGTRTASGTDNVLDCW